MLILPRGNMLSEVIPTHKVRIPVAHAKIKANSLTGYALLNFKSGASSALVYNKGELASVITHCDGKEFNNHEAINKLATLPSEEGKFAIYGLTPEMIHPMIAFAGGNIVKSLCEKDQTPPFQGVLDCIKGRQATAALRCYTKDRSCLAFYYKGAPVGFYHCKSQAIEISPSADIYAIASQTDVITEIRVNYDNYIIGLDSALEMANFASSSAQNQLVGNCLSMALEKEQELQKISIGYLGVLGRPLMEKEVAAAGGMNALLRPQTQKVFLASLSKNSKLLLGESKIKEMLTRIQTVLSDTLN